MPFSSIDQECVFLIYQPEMSLSHLLIRNVSFSSIDQKCHFLIYQSEMCLSHLSTRNVSFSSIDPAAGTWYRKTWYTTFRGIPGRRTCPPMCRRPHTRCRSSSDSVCMYECECMYVCMCEHVYAIYPDTERMRACVYVCMYVHVSMCIYYTQTLCVCAYVCMCAHV